MDLSYCVVNTNGRELLLACLAAIVEHAPAGIESEVLVVDNASDDGSAAAVEAWNAGPGGLGSRLRLLRRERREGKAALDSLLLSEARGELCLLLNEDTELRAGAVEALVEALRADPGAGAAGAQLVDPAGAAATLRLAPAGPWRRARERALPASLARGRERRPAAPRGRLGAVRGDARPPRRRPRRSPTWTPPSSSTRTRPTSPSAFTTRTGASSTSPAPSPSTTSSSRPMRAGARRRVVEFCRGRDLYLRKHHGAGVAAGAAAADRASLCAARRGGARAARTRPRALRPPRAPGAHPGRGEGLRESAAAYNAARSRRA